MAAWERKAKRERVGGVGEGPPTNGGGSGWVSLSAELLADVCARLTADEVSRTVPFVCRAWREAAMGPYFWEGIDVEQWCLRVGNSDQIDAAVRTLVSRGGGYLQRLCASMIGDSAFSCNANRWRCLKALRIPNSYVTDQIMEKHAASLGTLVELDISYCLNITPKGIEVIGKHCRLLVTLRRNMPYVNLHTSNPPPLETNEEALAIADTMPHLWHLELAHGQFSDHGLDAIVSKCRALAVLDIYGCWRVDMDGNLKDRCGCIPGFRGPLGDIDSEAFSLSDFDEFDGLFDSSDLDGFWDDSFDGSSLSSGHYDDSAIFEGVDVFYSSESDGN